MRALFVSIFLVSCDTKSDTQTSYCEALCDWGATCAAEEREIDASLEADCVTAAQATDSDCAAASTEGLGAAASALLTACTDDIAAGSGECSGFTGSIDALAVAAPPASCFAYSTSAQETFSAAQSAVTETNDQLCDRFALTYCSAMDTCLVSELGDIPQEVWDSLGGTATELCLASPGVASFSSACVDDALYAPEEDLTDINTARQGARECLRGLGDVACADLLSGEVPSTCAAAFTSTEQAVEFAEGLLSLTEQIEAVLSKQ